MIPLLLLFACSGAALAGEYGVHLGNLRLNGDHGVEGDVYVINQKSLYIRKFTYDGKAPDARFWVGNTPEPSPFGFIVPDELGSTEPLGRYNDKDIVITLPKGTFSDIKWLSVWCITYNANFGYVNISSDLQVPTEATLPKLKERTHGVKSGRIILRDSKTISIFNLHYDGAAPDAFFLVGKGSPNPSGHKVPDENGRTGKIKGYQGKDVTLRLPGNLTWYDLDWFALFCIAYKENFGEVYIPKNLNVPIDVSIFTRNTIPDMKNCIDIFPNELQVKWTVDRNSIYIQLQGNADSKDYIAFGISGCEDRACMIGADVAVAFYNKRKSMIEVVDYYLSSYAQCSIKDGACPDVRIEGSENIDLISGKHENNILTVTYRRHLKASENRDKDIELDKPTSVVAAIGPLNSANEVAKHRLVTMVTIMINFGQDVNLCSSFNPPVNPQTPPKPWKQEKIKNQNIFRAQIGPTGGRRGYTAVTGLPGWGYAWWINGYLIPELTVKRGLEYTFIVEGGNDANNKAEFHPFYITNNKEGGGYQYKNDLWTPKHMVYAGLARDENNDVVLTGVGRLCEYKFKAVDMSDSIETFEGYKKTLNVVCKPGLPGAFTWIPDKNTPDTVYYQCYTHRNFGWKIKVVNSSSRICLPWNLLLFLCFINIIRLFS